MKKATTDRYVKTAPPLTRAEFLALLKGAKAPQPHAAVADLLGPYLSLMQANSYPTTTRMKGPVYESDEVRRAKKRAKTAIKILRRELPIVVKWAPGETVIGPDIRSDAAQLLAALFDIERAGKYQPYVWHNAAHSFHAVYREVTADTRFSKSGPSVRFVQAALERLGFGPQSLSAIEKELRRHATETKI